MQRLLPMASAGRTHAAEHQAVVGPGN